MKTIVLVLALALAICAQNVTVGYARIRGTTSDPNIFGYALFTIAGDGNVTMTLNVSGITQNLGVNHGVHIHAFGDLSSGNGTSVGGHWNAFSMPHGCPETSGDTRHIGDTGNWMVDSTGSIYGSKTLDIMSLTGSTSSIIGFAVVVHNGTDNCVNETSSGARLAWGVIGVANPSSHGGSQNLATPITSYSANSGATHAVCVLTPAASQSSGASGISGTVYFTQTTNGVQVSATISGFLDTTPRGIHIHQWGDMSSNDGTSAGPHYTGAYYDVNQTHGIPGGPGSHHVGDMGNILVYSTNNNVITGQYYGVYDFFNVYTSGMDSIIGRAVVIHNTTDDCTGTNGNAGARIAYCVIGPANPSFGGALQPLTGVNSTQNVANCPGTSTSTTTDMSTTTGSAFSICFSFAVILAALLF